MKKKIRELTKQVESMGELERQVTNLRIQLIEEKNKADQLEHKLQADRTEQFKRIQNLHSKSVSYSPKARGTVVSTFTAIAKNSPNSTNSINSPNSTNTTITINSNTNSTTSSPTASSPTSSRNSRVTLDVTPNDEEKIGLPPKPKKLKESKRAPKPNRVIPETDERHRSLDMTAYNQNDDAFSKLSLHERKRILLDHQHDPMALEQKLLNRKSARITVSTFSELKTMFDG